MHILPRSPFPAAFAVGGPQAHHALPADGALSTTTRGNWRGAASALFTLDSHFLRFGTGRVCEGSGGLQSLRN